MKCAIGELSGEGIRYQDTRQGQQVGDFHTDSLGDLKVLASSPRKAEGNKFVIKTEKASGKIWVLMDTPSPSQDEITLLTTMIEEKTEGRTTAAMLNLVEQECPRMTRGQRGSSGERKEE